MSDTYIKYNLRIYFMYIYYTDTLHLTRKFLFFSLNKKPFIKNIAQQKRILKIFKLKTYLLHSK